MPEMEADEAKAAAEAAGYVVLTRGQWAGIKDAMGPAVDDQLHYLDLDYDGRSTDA